MTKLQEIDITEALFPPAEGVSEEYKVWQLASRDVDYIFGKEATPMQRVNKMKGICEAYQRGEVYQI